MGSSSRPLMLGLALIAVVAALAAIFWWADHSNGADSPPVETIDRLPAVPARAPLERPDGGGFRPHPDRAGLRTQTPER
ncbi:MAG TPA: hypothetical protein VFF06_07070 [Polyangia bacterium]|nr:hypothetical protein [Polyangia bacterium]